MHTLLDILTLSADYLKKKGIESPRRHAEELLAAVLGMGRMDLYLDHERPLEDDELQKCRAWLRRRGEGEPLPYIVGRVDFLECRLAVSPDVLIPRPETEILADTIVGALSQRAQEGQVLWDLCCGSGCLGIAIKKQVPQLQVSLIDICPKALAMAQRNATANEVAVECLLGDLLAPLSGRRADYLVCNPPYVTAQEYLCLDREVRDHEPKQALVGGETGLEYYKRLSELLPNYLNHGALAWFEIGDGQGSRVLEFFQAPCWAAQRVAKDWSGRERFFSLEFE